MYRIGPDQAVPLMIALVVWWLLTLAFAGRVIDLLFRILDLIDDHFEDILESRDRPSHEPGLTLLDQLRRRAKRRKT